MESLIFTGAQGQTLCCDSRRSCRSIRIEELDFDKYRVKVSFSIFGRPTPVELDFEQVELAK